MTGWDNFFLAQLGASAALAGLLFVALSMNLNRVLQFAYLPDRALQALLLLFGILILSSFLLVPGEPDLLLGVEISGVGVVVAGLIAALARHSLSKVLGEYRSYLVYEVGLGLLAALLYAAAGIVVAVWGQEGIYLTVPAILLSYSLAIVTSWVLLVEVNR